jgi:hypothetical protein
MEKTAEILFKLLGLGSLVVFINQLEFADSLYKIAINIPQPFRDYLLLVVLGIILVAYSKFQKS